MARTGSGKTAAFLLPLLHALRAHSESGGVRGLVLSPTRELAAQTHKFARDLAHFTDLRVCLLVGGESLEAQFEALAAAPDALVATPGRLLHHLAEVEGLSLRAVQLAVLDEADRLFEMGLGEQLRELLRRLPEQRQTLLFSATLPEWVADVARRFLAPDRVTVDLVGEAKMKASAAIRHLLISCTWQERTQIVGDVIRARAGAPGGAAAAPGGGDAKVIVFCETKKDAQDVCEHLSAALSSGARALHGDIPQASREKTLADFRQGKFQVLVATDVAARGLDVSGISLVVQVEPC